MTGLDLALGGLFISVIAGLIYSSHKHGPASPDRRRAVSVPHTIGPNMHMYEAGRGCVILRFDGDRLSLVIDDRNGRIPAAGHLLYLDFGRTGIYRFRVLGVQHNVSRGRRPTYTINAQMV